MRPLLRLFYTWRARLSHRIEQKQRAKDRALYRAFIDSFKGNAVITVVEKMVMDCIFTSRFNWNYPTTVEEMKGSIAKRNRRRLFNFLEEFAKRDSSLMMSQELIICYSVMIEAGLFSGKESKLMLNITIPDPEDEYSGLITTHLTDTEKMSHSCDGSC